MAALTVAGCAISTPLGPIFGSDDEGSTGTITPRDERFSNSMTDRDWTLAKGAVLAAIESREGQAPTTWDNPETGTKGTVSPLAGAFAADGGLCRSFIAAVAEGIETSYYEGRACRKGTDPWTVMESTAWTPPQEHGKP